MNNSIVKIKNYENEPVLSYAKNSPERKKLEETLNRCLSSNIEIPMYIGGEEVKSGKLVEIRPPHEIKRVVGKFHAGDKTHVELAIKKALEVKESWANLPWEQRASIFLKAADLLAGPYRAEINAATMIGQSKNAYQAEIDSACELIDFLRFNVKYMASIFQMQPDSNPGMWNQIEYRPLEGFVFALTPFNFTAIAGNLPSSAAMMGNVVVWKPSNTQIYAANIIMKVFKLAGLPDGVINLVYVSGPDAGDVIFNNPNFAGIHFTGSTGVFNNIWKTVANNIQNYKTYPRLVGETGGKDFVISHNSANPTAVATALSRGAFEYQGQKCSAASRAYLPKSQWPEIKRILTEQVNSFKMGVVQDFSNFINAVIDEKSFNNIVNYIEYAKESKDAEIIIGGEYDKTEGYFVKPTVIVTTDPYFKSMQEEIFGPVLTIYVYEDSKFEETLDILDKTSAYALTGALFAQDRYVIENASKKLANAAGNFYINDKPTGAVVGQQPFGGARGSGTNDKAGSMLNLLRWVSPRTIKETFVPAEDYRYPFLEV